MSTQRFLALDGMRGLAAISVMIYHRQSWLEPAWMLDHAYLAVDFFFILSGFVVSYAYGDRLKAGMTFGDFALRRIIRLYPLATLSVLLGMLKTLGFYLQGRIDGLVNLPATIVASLFLFPTFWEERLWPFNLALWSIFFEVVASLLFALVAVHLDLRRLVLVVIGLGGLLTLCVLDAGSLAIGHLPVSFWAGFVRVSFAFALGMLLLELYKRGWGAGWRWGRVAPVLLIASFILPRNALGGLYDLLMVFLLYPLIVLSGARVEPLFPRLATLSGDLSYPVYAMHIPLLFALGAASALAGQGGEPGLAGMIFRFGAVILMSWVALKIYDEPVRRFLGRLAAARADRQAVGRPG